LALLSSTWLPLHFGVEGVFRLACARKDGRRAVHANLATHVNSHHIVIAAQPSHMGRRSLLGEPGVTESVRFWEGAAPQSGGGQRKKSESDKTSLVDSWLCLLVCYPIIAPSQTQTAIIRMMSTTTKAVAPSRQYCSNLLRRPKQYGLAVWLSPTWLPLHFGVEGVFRLGLCTARKDERRAVHANSRELAPHPPTPRHDRRVPQLRLSTPTTTCKVVVPTKTDMTGERHRGWMQTPTHLH
jgi:hypothetical protein